MRSILFYLAASYASAQALDGTTRNDWPHFGGTQASWRYSGLDQINTANVRQLAPAWIFQTGDYSENLQATPLVVDGVMYVITARTQIFALNAASGDVIWQHRPPTPQRGLAGSQADFTGNRGLAVADGKVIFGTRDAYLVALDQKTGKEVWRVSVDDPKQCGCNLIAAPLIAKDKVIIGGNGGDQAHRGYLTAFNIKTGRLAWRWYVVPAPGEPGAETWKGDSWRFGGGSPWNTGSYDPQMNLVYWGTGNAAADFYDDDRSDDADRHSNLYTASVVALDLDTGKLRWYFQEVPDDVWDYDSAYEVILMDREVRGRPRKLLVHMNKSGVTFVLDRGTGEYLGAFNVVEIQTWMGGITEAGKIIGRKEPRMGSTLLVCPSAAGAKSWNPMAYSPRTGYIYTPTNETCSNITPNNGKAEEGRNFMNGDFPMVLPAGRNTFSHVDAYDPVTSKRIWSVPYRYMLLHAMLATAGDLVFTGDPEGNFFALNARTGEKLWNFQTGAGLRGASISYAVNGRQYVATTSGWQQTVVGGAVNGLFPAGNFRNGSSLVVFALGGGR